jgi:hypothetical protein
MPYPRPTGFRWRRPKGDRPGPSRFQQQREHTHDSATSREDASEEVASTVSVPTLWQPSHANGRWETIRYALDSWERTIRLCLILLVSIVAPVAAAVVAVLIHHALLCGSRSRRRSKP